MGVDKRNLGLCFRFKILLYSLGKFSFLIYMRVNCGRSVTIGFIGKISQVNEQLDGMD